ncbi:MAG: phosphatidylglycerophosphatase A [Proteobacteria bacterium]|nr:phosphatidylglycerophosphatase A [Pseudomonadota bacterium]
MLKLHEFFLTFFYSGKIKKAPGTFASLVSIFFWLLLTAIFFNHQVSLTNQNTFWGIFLTIAFIYGCLASPIYAKQFNQIDHQSIVIDEVVGQILALQITFSFFHHHYFFKTSFIFLHLLLCFTLFRFFDIKKPWLIGYADRNFKNGFGVMFDDLLSGFVAAILAFFFLKLTLMIR